MEKSHMLRNTFIIVMTILFTIFLTIFLIKTTNYINNKAGYYAFIGCIITLIGNIIAIYFTTKITNENTHKLYLKEAFIKRMNELFIKANEILLLLHEEIDEEFGLFFHKNDKIITFEMLKFFFLDNVEIKEKYNILRRTHYELLETYNINIKSLMDGLANCNHIITILTKEQYDPAGTKIKNGNNQEIDLKSYLTSISQDLLCGRNRIIDLIQNKIKE